MRPRLVAARRGFFVGRRRKPILRFGEKTGERFRPLPSPFRTEYQAVALRKASRR